MQEFLFDVAQLIDNFGKDIDFLTHVLDRSSSVELLLQKMNNAEAHLLYEFPNHPLKINEMLISCLCPEKRSEIFL